MKKCNRLLCRSVAVRLVKVRGVFQTMIGDVLYEEHGEFCDKHADKLLSQARRRGREIVINTRLA